MDTNFYNGKKVLVTGGVGSIGSEIVRQLAELKTEIIRIFDNNETGLFHMGERYGIDKVRLFVGDIRDKERLLLAMDDVDIVFHAAALKHVSLCEYNPFDAVKTNVTGTQNVILTALEKGVSKVIFISTDKAVNPTGVMGATKLLAERLMIAARGYSGENISRFSSVRFGNVLDSSGSVIPIFRKQIKEGKPITITDRRMTRFFMSIPEAASLVLTAGELAEGGEVFVLKMPAVRITDIAITMAGFTDNNKNQFEFIGRRGGEKLHEELITEEESSRTYENKKMFVILPPNHEYLGNKSFRLNEHDFLKTENLEYTSNTVKQLTPLEIKKLIDSLEG